MRAWIGVAAAAWLLATGADAAQVTEPDWLRRPKAEDVARAFPDLAEALEIPGRATVSCAVDTGGRTRNCVVLSEFPVGLGFGTAALEIAKDFRFSPKTIDGRPVPGGSVRVPIRFTLPETEAAPAIPPTPTPAWPGAPTLAARLKPGLARLMQAGQAAWLDELIAKSGEASEEAREAGRQAYRQAARSLEEAWVNATAAVYAALLSEKELTTHVELLASPAGQAIQTKAPAGSKAVDAVLERTWRSIGAAVRSNYCAQHACEAADWRDGGPGVFSNAVWATEPTAHEIAEIIPPLPRLMGVPGWAQLNCYVGEGGELESCIRARESPEGMGFSHAARSLEGLYRLAPAQTAAGAGGEVVAVVVRFPVHPSHTDPPPTSPGAVNRAEERWILARRLVEVEDLAARVDEWEETLGRSIDEWSSQDDPAASGGQAFRAAMAAARSAILDGYATAYASTYAAEELELLIRHRQSSAGLAMAARRSQFNEGLMAVDAAYGRRLSEEARRLFCAERTCQEAPPARAPPAP